MSDAPPLSPRTSHRIALHIAPLQDYQTTLPTPDYSTILLQLKHLHKVTDLPRFQFIKKPAPRDLKLALHKLYVLALINDKGDVTDQGKMAAEMNIPVEWARAVLRSNLYSCSEEMLIVAAVACTKGVYKKATHASPFAVTEGDAMMHLNAYSYFQNNKLNTSNLHQAGLNPAAMAKAESLRGGLREILRKYAVNLTRGGDICKCVASGLFMNGARLDNTSSHLPCWRDLKDKKVELYIHPESALFSQTPEFVVYGELAWGSAGAKGKKYMKDVTAVAGEWFIEVASHYYELRHKHAALNNEFAGIL